MRLLLVEDHTDTARALARLLENRGFTTQIAPTIATALEVIGREEFDLYLCDLGLPDDAEHVNPNGGAIAIGHPLGASGARLIMTAAYQLRRTGGRYALCTMCIGVGQGIATIIERI